MPATPLPIWTLEARDSVMLEVVSSLSNLSPEAMRDVIKGAHEVTVEALDSKGISYKSLRNALTPQRDRLERAFLFDTACLEESGYGFPVAEALIPLLPRQLSCSIQLGDLIIEDQELGFDLLRRHVVAHRDLELAYTNQIYCLYLNNLTEKMAESITAGLKGFDAFFGYVDTSTSSPMKDWLSLTLVDGYLKHRGLALNGHEDDVSDDEDRNMFLGYKIERGVRPGAETDTHFALTAISGRPLPLPGLRVEVAKAKAKYLKESHGASLARAGLAEIDDEELAAMIKAKINDSYIYNLRYLEEHDSSLFNIMLEVQPRGEGKLTRLLASLEYCPDDQLLKLMTLY